MTTLMIEGQSFKLEFRYARIRPDRRREKRAPNAIKVVTTCVVLTDKMTAIENAFCVELDNFSRETGRRLAFEKLLKRCGPLRKYAVQLQAEFDKRWPVPQLALAGLSRKLSEHAVSLLKNSAEANVIRNRRRFNFDKQEGGGLTAASA